jgi:hypothetical protein
MKISGRMRKLICCAAALLGTAAILTTVPLFAHQGANEDNSEAMLTVKAECTFSDGSTISFGHKGMGEHQSGDDVWQTGNYAATAFRVTKRMRIPPLDDPTDIPAGSYTVFVDASKDEPWTLIISKKTGKAMLYPGKQYDVGRTQMGFDDTFRIAGCEVHNRLQPA